MTTRLLLPVVAGLLLAACSSSSGEGFLKPGLDIGSIQRIAVVDGPDKSFDRKTRMTLLDAFQFEFFKRGWPTVDRTNIDQAIEELNFQNSDLASSADRRKLGEVLNVDAIVVVNLGQLDNDVMMSAKMLDPQTGDVLWMGEGTGSLNKTMNTILGAAVGAAAGAAVGDDGTITTIGGAVGGAAGYALGPTQLENAKSVVTKVMAGLPSR